MVRKILIFIILMTMNVSICYTQITIGSAESPELGALLQLKNIDGAPNGAANATAGLMLPRVQLKAPNLLTPMYASDDATYLGNKAELDQQHAGLIVYNTNECLYKGYGPGVYVWGEEWSFVGDKKSLAELMTFKDQDENEFKARRFGNAGIWMVENLNATKYADGGAIEMYGGIPNPRKYYAYPNYQPGGPGYTNKMPVEQSPNGILYSIHAAKRNFETVEFGDQGQVAGDVPGPNEVESRSLRDGKDSRGYSYIQGICPYGWHLPSDREWNNLEKELFENADKYSTYTQAELPGTRTWDPLWISTNGSRGGDDNSQPGHGAVMKSVCIAYSNDNIKNTNGKSLLLTQGGFDAPLVGYIVGATTVAYGKGARFFSSSATSLSSDTDSRFTSWGRALKPSSSGVARKPLTGLAPFASVRCVMNE